MNKSALTHCLYSVTGGAGCVGGEGRKVRNKNIIAYILPCSIATLSLIDTCSSPHVRVISLFHFPRISELEQELSRKVKAEERIEAQKKVRPAALVYSVYESCDCHVTVM